MATALPPIKTHGSPAVFARETCGRRSSSRNSAMSPLLESPRTLCPRDGDAFSYAAGHLPAWYISQELWQRLPSELQSSLAAMQHAGAAVLTGFERVEQHSVNTTKGKDTAIRDDDIVATLQDSIPMMPTLPPLLRGDSVISTELEASMCSSVFTSSSSSVSISPPYTPVSEASTPISPMALAPLDKSLFSGLRRVISRERSFSTPLEPHDAYYITELSQLRTESLPRLRHSIRKVDTRWIETKRGDGLLSTDEINEFENWLAEKKYTMLTLDTKCKTLSEAAGLSSNGLGWTAP
ncbi:hypothetical protein B0J11DRAFT_442072 [Dendryphion nanum]|uniref:Uncharacterized protein n=1 Tax=Dendryphion nanum TaxID=256645 RepID=A0A9P9IFB5_9PLEO|nr:hypothetical protein B0J11DRAFT_442072 [Dendryphion nanum]